ncbi:MAG: hypothetical protein SH817_08585 [Leptospira sp.]|nr:hypothetical protein [Leptospira sp.]
MSLEFKINDQFFKSSLLKFATAEEKVIRESLEKVGYRIVKDAVTLAPKAPILDGFLTGAFTVAVTDRDTIYPAINGKAYPKAGDTGENSKVTLKAEEIGEVDLTGMKKFELRVGNSMIYAARWHENPFTPGPWSERRGNVGYKFISIKLYGYGDQYLKLLAGFIKDAMNGRLFT